MRLIRYRIVVVAALAVCSARRRRRGVGHVGLGSGPPTATGTGGAAASVERIATQAAIDTLRAGGNAVDAAIAAGGVLGVTEPFSAGSAAAVSWSSAARPTGR